MFVKLRAVLIFGVINQIVGWVIFELEVVWWKKSQIFFQRPFKVLLQNVNYETFYPEVADFNITIKNRIVVDVHINVLRDIPQLFVDFEDLHDSGDGAFDMVFTNQTVDLCMFLRNRKSNVFFDIVYRMLSDYGDVPKQCPIRKVTRTFYFSFCFRVFLFAV